MCIILIWIRKYKYDITITVSNAQEYTKHNEKAPSIQEILHTL